LSEEISKRFERIGGAPDIEADFKTFVLQALRGKSLDDEGSKLSSAGKFPDFICYEDKLRIELKTLVSDQSDRLNNVFQEKVLPNELPHFYGHRRSDTIFPKLSNAEEIKKALLNKLGRTIETIIKNANQQFKSYNQRHPSQEALNLLVILNSTLDEFDPSSSAWLIRKRMMEVKNDKPRFQYIDAALYISEKHVQKNSGYPNFVTVIVEGYGVSNSYLKSNMLMKVNDAWSIFRTGAPSYSIPPHSLKTVELKDVPDQMTRSEAWVLEYERNPYLATASTEQLRKILARCAVIADWHMMKGDWIKPSQLEAAESRRRFMHVMTEANRRGLDMNEIGSQTIPWQDIVDAMPQELPAEVRSLLEGHFKK